MSWLFWIVLQWTLGYMYAFESSFFSYIPRSGTARSYGTSIFKELFSIVAAPIYIPTNLIGEFPSLHTLSSIYCLQIFWWCPSRPYEVIPHCSFDSHFSDIWWASLVSQVVKNLLAVQETWVWSLGWKISWRREWLPTLAFFAWRIPWTKEPCCCCSVIKSCSTLCDPKDCSIPGLPILHDLPESAQTHVLWVSDAMQPSHPVVPFSSCLQSFSASGSFPMSWLCPSGGQSIGDSALASVLPMNVQGWFHLGLTGLISLQSKGLSRVFSSTTVWKHQFFSAQSSLWSNAHPYMTTGKTIALTIQSFVSKVMSLLFNMLSMFIIAFLSRSKSLLISWLQSPPWFGSPRR